MSKSSGKDKVCVLGMLPKACEVAWFVCQVTFTMGGVARQQGRWYSLSNMCPLEPEVWSRTNLWERVSENWHNSRSTLIPTAT